MWFAICTVLVVASIQLGSTGYVPAREPSPYQTYAQPSNVCNDELIKTIAQKIELIEATNQNIQLKLHTSSVFTYEHFEELKTAIYALDHSHKDKAKYCACNATGTLTSLDTSSGARGFNTVAASIDENANASGASLAVATAANATGFSTTNINLCQSGQNGIQLVQLPNSKLSPFFVNCIQAVEQGDEPWILIQRRRDGSIDFYREWCDYQRGFGNLEGEFFMGLDKLHALTQSALYELWIQMEDFENATRWARYSSFAIGDESQAYALNILGNYSGNAGDSLIYHQGQKFYTKDKDNDRHCALNFYGAWWYKDSQRSNLNGKYLLGAYTEAGRGIDWDTWHGHNYSLKYVHMAIRPVRPS